MDRRQEIFDTALEIFISHGYDNTPLPCIAKALGFTKAIFFIIFIARKSYYSRFKLILGKKILSLSPIILPIKWPGLQIKRPFG
jgi:hypothetical protein